MTKNEAIQSLTGGENLRVPCSRYGRDSLKCAEVAYAATQVMLREIPDSDERETLDYVMGLVANDHDDIAYLIGEYGTAEEKAVIQ